MAEEFAFLWDVTGHGPKILGNKYGNREGFKTIRIMANSKDAAIETATAMLPENRREEITAKKLAKSGIANWDGPKGNDV